MKNKKASAQSSARSGRYSLRILATSDLHMHLLGHDYYTDTTHVGVGLSRTACLIAEAREEVAAQGGVSLLLDNGDWMQGTPLGDIAITTPQERHPATIAFEHLHYDAIGLGNHEFNYGLEPLAHVLRSVHCPVLCSNLTVLEQDLALNVQGTALIERDVPGAPPGTPPVRIGLLSLLPPQTMIWDADLLRHRVDVTDMVECAHIRIAELREAGADLIVALAHTGIGEAQAEPNMENALHPLTSIDGLDAAIGGHTHLIYPPQGEAGPNDPTFAVPVVIPGPGGSHLGQIDFEITHDGTGWSVHPHQAKLRALNPNDAYGSDRHIPEDPEIVAKLATVHARTRAAMNEPVGHTDVPLHSYFSFFGEDRALALAAQAQAAALRPALHDSPYAELPLLSAIAPAKFGGRAGPRHYTDVPAGKVSKRHVADIYIFPNEVRGTVVTGQQLLDWLEMSACIFPQFTPGAPSRPLQDPERVGHNFDVIYGVTYEIDITQPCQFDLDGRRLFDAPGRIQNLRWNGAPIAAEQRFAVALNNYRMSGGGNFRMLENAPQICLNPQLIRQAVEHYISDDLREPLAKTPWRFAANLGVEATALTGPGAVRYLSELPPHAKPSSTIRSDGFMELRLSL